MKRRTLLISSAATLGLVAIGSGAWVYEDRQVFIPQLLQRLVGNFQMDLTISANSSMRWLTTTARRS
jgi:hypothetical protein